MIAVKLALAFFFLRILTPPSSTQILMRRTLIVTVTLSTLIGIAYFFFAVFQCGSISGSGTLLRKMKQGQCASADFGLAMGYSHGVITMLTDWVCGLLPVFILWNSKMPRRAKVVVGLLLGFAAV
jgi:putative copper export protein